MKRLLALALLALLALPLAAGHAEPFASQPASGERLDAAPELVWVDFTEPVFRDGSWIRVADADGVRVDNDDLEIIGDARPRMQVTLPADVPDGAYRIQWQTYSQSDGHTIKGSIGFAVGGFAPPSTTTDEQADGDLRAAAARAVLYAGAALGIGALAFSWRVARSPVTGLRSTLVLGGGLAFVGTAWLFVDTWLGTGLGLSAYARSDGGNGFLWRMATAALATLIAWRQPTSWSGKPLGILWAIFAWQTASFGHITREGTWAIALEWIHFVAAATWIGGLWLFLRRIRHGDAQTVGSRFTRLAQWAVLFLVASGIAITAWLVGSIARHNPGRLLDDSWTWFLAAKVGLVVLMLGLATLNRYVFLEASGPLFRAFSRWRPDWTATGAARGKALKQAVRLEVLFSAGTIIAAGLLLSVSPPTDEVMAEAADLERTAQGTDYVALMQLSPSPAVGQSHTARFFLTEDATGEPLTNNTCGRDDCIRMRWVMEGDESTAQEAAAAPEGDGWWRVEDVLFVASGNTTVALDVQSAYVYLDTLTFEPFVV